MSEPQKNAVVPEASAVGALERNSNATPRKMSAEQHDEDREVHRRDDDRERERKRREQADAAEHEPRLVAVPDRRDRVHHQRARRRRRRRTAYRMPTPRSKPSSSTYMNTASAEDHRPDAERDRWHASSPLPSAALHRCERVEPAALRPDASTARAVVGCAGPCAHERPMQEYARAEDDADRPTTYDQRARSHVEPGRGSA